MPGVEYADGSVSGYAQFVAPNGKAVSTGGAPTIGVSVPAAVLAAPSPGCSADDTQ